MSDQRIPWKYYWMLIAKNVALRSTCNSRPNGAIIVSTTNRILTSGYNGALPGKDQCSDNGPDFCYRRSVKGREDDKYNVCPGVHAEENAVVQAAKLGIPIDGAHIYCTLSPCLVCAKTLRAVGISKVYYELAYSSSDPKRDKEWMDFNESQLYAEQVRLPFGFHDLIWNNIHRITSERRL